MAKAEINVNIKMPFKVRVVMFFAPVLGFILTDNAAKKLCNYCIDSVIYEVSVK